MVNNDVHTQRLPVVLVNIAQRDFRSRATKLGHRGRVWFKVADTRYSTVVLRRGRDRKWYLCYNGEASGTGGFARKDQAINWYMRGGR